MTKNQEEKRECLVGGWFEENLRLWGIYVLPGQKATPTPTITSIPPEKQLQILVWQMMIFFPQLNFSSNLREYDLVVSILFFYFFFQSFYLSLLFSFFLIPNFFILIWMKSFSLKKVCLGGSVTRTEILGYWIKNQHTLNVRWIKSKWIRKKWKEFIFFLFYLYFECKTSNCFKFWMGIACYYCDEWLLKTNNIGLEKFEVIERWEANPAVTIFNAIVST